MVDVKQNWQPLNIPEGQINDYKIIHKRMPAGTTLETANARNVFIGGQQNIKITFEASTTWHELQYEGGTWMTDLPCEQAQHDAILEEMADAHSVLVGGLGIGYAVTHLVNDLRVGEIICVEKSLEVCQLVYPHLDPAVRRIVSLQNVDLFDYLRVCGRQFEYAFYDIWQSDGEGVFFGVVCPLRKLSEGIVLDSNVLCWNENVMRGQLNMSLISRVMMVAQKGEEFLDRLVEGDGDDELHLEWTRDFFVPIKEGRVTLEDAEDLIPFYANGYGRPGFNWEEELERLA